MHEFPQKKTQNTRCDGRVSYEIFLKCLWREVSKVVPRGVTRETIIYNKGPNGLVLSRTHPSHGDSW